MREFGRIDRILNKIKILWEIYPDQRLGQLLQNYAWGRQGDYFFVEDTDTEEHLDRKLKEHGVE